MSTQVKPDPARTVLVQKQRANVYTMMLILAFAAIATACIFLYMLMNKFYLMKQIVPQEDKAPPRPAPVTLIIPAAPYWTSIVSEPPKINLGFTGG